MHDPRCCGVAARTGPGVLCGWGKTTPCVCPLRVRGSVCYPVLQSAPVACVGNEWGECLFTAHRRMVVCSAQHTQ
eukprot:181383-Prymnesium_polylepis.1